MQFIPGSRTSVGGSNLWSDPATWAGAGVPVAGAMVSLTGQTVVLDVVTPELASVMLNAGATLIASGAVNTQLTTKQMMMNAGSFYLSGTVASPNTKKHTLMLTGLCPSTADPGYSHQAHSDTPVPNYPNDAGGVNRGMMVNNGATWKWYDGNIPAVCVARVNITTAGGSSLVAAGATVIPLDQPVFWKAGDEIAITPTGFYDDTTPRRTEFFHVVSDTNGASSVTITPGLGFARWAKLQYLNDNNTITVDASSGFTLGGLRATTDIPTTIDQRAKVLHMTRGHLITCPNDTEFTDKRFGAHCMVMMDQTAAAGTVPSSVVYLKGVQFDRGGQGGLQGRYPMHWHMTNYKISTGEQFGDFPVDHAVVEDCTMTRSQNRALTFHGCRGVRATRILAVDFMGHGFFFEDGPEQNNTLEYSYGYLSRDPGIGSNSAQQTHAPRGYRIKAHDANSSWDAPDGASGLWATNPQNIIRYNHFGDTLGPAMWNPFSQSGPAGATGACFGVSSKVNIVPYYLLPLEWHHNEGHCSRAHGREGLMVQYNEYGDISGANKYANSVAGSYTMTDEFYHHNKFGGYHHTVFRPHYERFVFADNPAAFIGDAGGYTRVVGGFDIHGTTQLGTGTGFCFIEKSLNTDGLTYGLKLGAVSYHGTFHFHDLTAIGYQGDPTAAGDPIPAAMEDRMHLWTTCFFGGFDNYTDPFFSYSQGMTNWHLGTSWGMYMTPGPNVENSAPFSTWSGGTMNNSSSGVPWNSMCTAFYDAYGTIFGQGAGKTIIINIPFLTQNVVSVDLPRPGGRTTANRVTSQQYWGINCQDGTVLDTASSDISRSHAIYTRVNPADLTDYAGVTFDTGGPGYSLGTNYPGPGFCLPINQAVRFTFPDNANPIKNGRWIIQKALDNVADWFIMGFPWANATTLSAVQSINSDFGGTPVNIPIPSGGNTKAAFLAATAACYWRDTINNMLWVKYYQPASPHYLGSSGDDSFTEDYRMILYLSR